MTWSPPPKNKVCRSPCLRLARCRKSKRLRDFNSLAAKPASLWGRIQREILSRFQVIGLEREDAVAAADVLSPLVDAGQNIAVQDVMLAGMALRRGLTLVTRNRRDFDRMTGLQMEN